MRRAIVLFLIFLFPLHVFALSCSDVAVNAVAGDETISVSFGDAASDGSSGQLPDDDEIDPDEPPSGADYHDWVQDAGRARLAIAPDVVTPSLLAPHRGRAPLPPVKPPPRA